MSVDVIGEKVLLAQLAKLENAVQKDSLEEAANAGAKIVVEAAKENISEDTGRAKENIHQETYSKTQTKAEVDVAPESKGAFYTRFLEFGTSKMSARPFMRPAIDNNQDIVVEKIKTTLADKIEGIGDGS
jgi:HK97 gp10 family phage protein